MRIDTQLAYILHKRPFRDSSQILEVFTREHGRLSLMSRGSRNPRAKVSGILQLFKPLLIGWQGRGELPFLNKVDVADIKSPVLSGNALKSAMYVNELLVYLLHRNDVNAEVFDHYHACLYRLSETPDIEICLRLFEKTLLQQLGFGLNLLTDADSDEAVEPGSRYAYHAEHGPVLLDKEPQGSRIPLLSGDSLLAFSQNRLENSRQYAEIKSLMRYVLNWHLGHRQLKSRELFRPSSRLDSRT